jgi:GH24 family phage-related lysozyme (muramidase)
MALHGVSRGSGSDSLAAAAFAMGVESVHENRAHSKLERELNKAESSERQAKLEQGRQALKSAADKQLMGAIISGALQMGAGACQFATGSCSTSAWDKRLGGLAGTLNGASKLGDAYGATAGYDQADKALYDQQAEVAQQRAQDAQQARNAADETTRRELNQLEDVVKTACQAAAASVRA